MPIVRFQLLSLTCEKTEDRGLLDSRSEDEVYLHGAMYCEGQVVPLLAGESRKRQDAPFRHLNIKDGETVDLASDDHCWTVEVSDWGRLTVGLTAHEEDANRAWPAAQSLLDDIATAARGAVDQAVAQGRSPAPEALVAASASVMRSQTKFEADDLLGHLLLADLDVEELMPDSFEQICRFAGGTRLLASDFEYTLRYRISRDDRDFRFEIESGNVVELAMLPGSAAAATLVFRNVGEATCAGDDLVLIGPPELAAWLALEAENLALDSDGAGLLLTVPHVAPGESFSVSVAVAAPDILGKSSFRLRWYVRSLKHFVPHPPLTLSLSSGRRLSCEVETVRLIGNLGAEVRVLAKDEETLNELTGTVKITGDEAVHPTSEAFEVSSNMRHLVGNPTSSGRHDQIVWPFASVQVDGYWPELVSLQPR